uniref:G protein-coupled receptor n=1 Tax=Bursaphelenchus xylophilus TaxID=6326 RepID=A0A1I7RRI7_BURXY
MLEYDARVSLNISRVWTQSNLSRDARFPLLLIEWSAHGIPWLIFSVSVFIYVCVAEYSQEIQWKWAVLLFGKVPLNVLHNYGQSFKIFYIVHKKMQ